MSDRYELRDKAQAAAEHFFQRELTEDEQTMLSFVVGFIAAQTQQGNGIEPLVVSGEMPTDETIRTKMQAAAILIDGLFNENRPEDTVGWVLMGFPIKEDALVGFVGNGQPDVMLRVLKAAVAKFERGSHHAAGHA